MEDLISVIEYILYICVVVFPISTLLLIQKVKKENLKFIDEAVKRPIIPNVDLGFFSDLRNKYHRITGQKFLVNINKISFYFMLICFPLLFILIVAAEVCNF